MEVAFVELVLMLYMPCSICFPLVACSEDEFRFSWVNVVSLSCDDPDGGTMELRYLLKKALNGESNAIRSTENSITEAAIFHLCCLLKLQMVVGIAISHR